MQVEGYNYMFGSKAAIRKYHQTLPLALSKRYGRAKQYTQGQVDTTIQVLNLNKRYALLFCTVISMS
ncbi:DUF6559 family protein [Pseudoalteromonas pernae]|uniref:DUF6559 family protein n=1 Tax=Pseudoalteromonas pernae TaxID=3118054 RepID=UPI003F8156A3